MLLELDVLPLLVLEEDDVPVPPYEGVVFDDVGVVVLVGVVFEVVLPPLVVEVLDGLVFELVVGLVFDPLVVLDPDVLDEDV
jgi:hypothetical protein